MTTSTLPAQLQASNTALRSLHKPHQPFLEDTVKDSESALDGDSIWDVVLFALLPWWAEDFALGGSSDDNGNIDYYIGTPLAFIASAAYFGFATDVNGWQVYAVAMISAVATFLGLIVFHMIFHKCISRFLYNRLFRRAWMKKMREADKVKYEADVASYPQRLKDYEEAHAVAVNDANTVLKAYNASLPAKKYKLGEYGFEQVSGLESALGMANIKAKTMFGKMVKR